MRWATHALAVWLLAICGNSSFAADVADLFVPVADEVSAPRFTLNLLDDDDPLPAIDWPEVVRAQSEDSGSSSGNLAAKSQNPQSRTQMLVGLSWRFKTK